jgi:hypothetical protein
MEKEIFKVGDRVFHFLCGWGTIKEIKDSMIYIEFNGQKTHVSSNNNLLSFTEYTLQGFSQERPIILPEVGELCLVRDFKDSVWKARNFKKFTTHFLDGNGERWDYFKRIKILD